MMFIKKILFGVVIAIGIMGCAKRTYLQAPKGGVRADSSQKSMACDARFAGSNLCVTVAWEKPPTEGEFGAMTFKIWRENRLDGTPVLIDMSGPVSVVLWMPSMGHGSSPVTVDKLDLGTYRATQMFFSMGGDWEIRFRGKTVDGAQDQAVLPFHF